MWSQRPVDRVRKTENGIEALDAYVEFWGNYIPEIYGLAKALLALLETDEAAKAAWDDRGMGALRGGCCTVIDCLERERFLAPGWKPAEAVDMMWAMLSVPNWEILIKACHWSTSQYIHGMQAALKQIFVGCERTGG